MSKTENAFAVIHFGSNVKYFELELYFCIMLRQNTSQNIIYMYSETDTPASFVEQIKPFVYKTIGFNDQGITYNVTAFESKYTSFNTLRTCDFIFAYKFLTNYKKVCIIESDLVLMGNIDSIFQLNTPSIVCYKCGEANLNKNLRYTSDKEQIIQDCDNSGVNGGIMLIEPSIQLFDEYIKAVPIIANRGCKYPNEALFEYVNNVYYNLPVKYNLSHYHTLRLSQYGLNPDGRDILVYHFNETDFKHLDIIKDGWLKANINDPKVMSKYRLKKLPIMYFESTIYEPNKKRVNEILANLNKPQTQTQAQIPIKEVGSKKSDWVEAFSKTHNRPYWSNKVTKESVWKKPNELLGGKKTKRKQPNKKRKNTKQTTNKRKYTNKKSRK
uniref:WW domain-containing protein n=1 Tax=viral metagenome TaxID=1070528 RepID=A0A6C0ITG1_9ZZZZ